MIDPHPRTKPRVNIVLSEDERAAADRLAAERGMSLSVLIGQLIRAEVERGKRKRIRGWEEEK